ncbi:MAG: DUF3160 domain-containing protein [Deltaproteobacteria bacterium]|nr:DUF3160 domain-containing protein [Deltaproteobacteria bacterium]
MIRRRHNWNIIVAASAVLVPCLGAGSLAPSCSCRRDSPAADAAGPSRADAPASDAGASPPGRAAAHDSGPLADARSITNLDWYPGLTNEHLHRLSRDGFFLAASPARGAFQVYERNERLGLPSFVTPALLLDVVRGVGAAVQRDVEESFVGPIVHRALHAVVRRGIELRRRSLDDPPPELGALDRVIAIFAVGAHLLGAEGARPDPAAAEPEEDWEGGEAHADAGFVPLLVPFDDLPWPDLPPAATPLFQEALSRIRAADDVYSTALLGREVDFRVFRTVEAVASARGRALLRTLLWLDLAGPSAAADLADDATGSLVLRLLADARSGDDDVGVLWDRAARLLEWCGRSWHGTDATEAVTAFRASVLPGGELPANAGGSIRAVLAAPGVPPRGTMGLLPGPVGEDRCVACDQVARWLGPAAPFPPAAVTARPGLAMGGAVAAPGPSGVAVRADPGAVAAGGRVRVEAAAWGALSAALEPWGGAGGVLFRRPAPPAGRGAPDCVPAGAASPHGAVATVPRFFDDVAAEAAGMLGRLAALGVLPETELEDPRGPEQSVAYRIQELLLSVERLARALGGIVRADLRGEEWSEDQLAIVARAGSWAESILAEAAAADAVDPGDPRWVASRGATVDGVGGIDVLYVVIDTPQGPVLARGAVVSVRGDLVWPFADQPVTDEAWRAWLDSATPPPRPAGAAERLAPPFPPPPLVGEGNRSCLGPDSGGDLAI